MEQNTKTGNKPVAKGNKTTEVVVGAAVLKLQSAVKAMNTAVEEVNKFDQRISDSTLQVVNLEDKIGGLEQDFKNKVAQNKIEIEQKFQQDEEEFAQIWLDRNNKIAINEHEHQELKDQLAEAKHDVDKKVSIAVNAATGAMAKTHADQLTIKDLEYKTREANNVAEMNQLKSQVKFMEDQVNHWKNELTAERAASVERSKANTAPTINVGKN